MVKRTILIDDDSDDLIFLRDAILQVNETAECTTFDDASNAVKYLEQQHILDVDIVVIDYNMPKIDGLECLKRLVKLSVAGRTQFVVYSSAPLPAHIEASIVALGARVVLKPNTYSEFNLLVHKLLKEQG